MVELRHPSGLATEAHEVCFLRGELQAAQLAQARLTQFLAGVLYKLGGTVRIHAADIEAARAQGVPVRTRPEGKFLIVSLGEEKRVVPASERELPKPDGRT